MNGYPHFLVLRSRDHEFTANLSPHLRFRSDEDQIGRPIAALEKRVQKPSSLLEFKNVWNDLESLQILVPDLMAVPNKMAHIHENNTVDVEVEDVSQISKTDSRMLERACEGDPPSSDQESVLLAVLGLKSVDLVCVVEEDDGSFLIPFWNSHSVTINALAVFVTTHPYWKTGSFASSFSELDTVTTGIQDKSFEYITAKLAQEASKPKTDSFEIFGVKFPVETASRWGIVLIVGIQLYLWIHLYELSPKLKEGDEGWNVAWIGVYQSLPARILFLASTALLPIATVVLLGTHALKGAGWTIWAIYIAALLASLGLSWMIAKGIPKHEESVQPRVESVASTAAATEATSMVASGEPAAQSHAAP
jgi:hypothetical protein